MKKLKFILVLPLLFSGVFLIIYLINKIKVKEIACSSQYGLCSPPIGEKLASMANCSYFSCKKNIDSFLADSLIVDRYNYQIKLPLKIEVNLIEKKPIYSIKSLSENSAVQIDKDGMVLEKRESSALPGYFIRGDLPEPGEKLSEKMYFALKMFYGVSKIQGIKDARLEENYLFVMMDDGKNVLFPLEGDGDLILGALTLILNELNKEGTDSKIDKEQIKVIDLRFKNPVLR